MNQRRFVEPIQECVVEGIDLIVPSAGIDAAGNPTAMVQVWNGELLFSDRIALAVAASRQKYANLAARAAKIDSGLIEKALLRLTAGLPATLETMPTEEDDDHANDGLTVAERILSLASDAYLFHTADQEAYATIAVAGHAETWSIKSRAFNRWLRRLYWEQTHSVPRADALNDALGVLEGIAQFSSAEHAVAVRIAEYENAIFIDLANDEWEAVEVTATGWRIVTDPPVRFKRSRGMLPLPTPTRNGNIHHLRGFVNIREDRDWVLIVSWLVAALRPRGPYPVLVLHGQQGSAKSTLARILRCLVDPSSVPLRAEPRDARDLMIAASNARCVVLDNLSHLPVWLSDSLCRLATGGGFGTRELYTDGEEVLFDAQRPVIVNGIQAVATRGDLFDRAILAELTPIDEAQRRPESQLWLEFEQLRPAIFGALLDAMSIGVRDLENTKLDSLPRMADFAIWATATEPGFGWKPGTVMAAYAANRADNNDIVLEGSPVVAGLRALAKAGWTGTCDELLTRLTRIAADIDCKAATSKMTGDERDAAITKRADYLRSHAKDWPHSARALREVLNRLAPNLIAAGVQIVFGRESHTGRRLVTIAVDPMTQSPPSPSSPPPNTDDETCASGSGPSSSRTNPRNGVTDPVTGGDDGDGSSESLPDGWEEVLT